MAKAAKQPRAKAVQVAPPGGQQPKQQRWQIESPTRGLYVGSTYAERARDWPIFTHLPQSEDRIIRFNEKAAAEAELVWVRGYAANARLREV